MIILIRYRVLANIDKEKILGKTFKYPSLYPFLEPQILKSYLAIKL